MRAFSAIPVDTLKRAGFSDVDVEYILDQTEKYHERWNVYAATFQGVPESLRREIVQIATNSFRAGMAAGIGKARNIPNAAKKFGFAT